MRRLWIILALILASCTAPTEPPAPPDTPTPTQEIPTPTATAPTNTPTTAPSDTPSGPPGLPALLFDTQQVWREASIGATALPSTDLRPELVESGNCPVDCARLFYPTESGAMNMTITTIEFEDPVGASEMVRSLMQENLANGGREVTLSENAVGVDYLPEGSRVVYLDQTWSVFAPYGNIFVSVILQWTVEIDFPLPEDDVISFSLLTAQVTSAQIEALIKAGY